MIKEAVMHINETNYCFALNKEQLKLRLRVAKSDQDIKKITCLWNISYFFIDEQFEKEMTLAYEDDFFAYYECILTSKDPRFSYIFKFETKSDGNYFYSEVGFERTYDFSLFYMSAFKMPYINELDIPYQNDKFSGEVMYQIFPDRFYMGNHKKDTSYINRAWDSTDLKGTNNNAYQDIFLGGDLQGVIAKLPYLHDLGIHSVYLTPICKSKSNHKYDVEDYFKIDPMFGDDNDLLTLVNDAHKLGMVVILDLVFNHSSDRNVLFQDVIKNGKDSKYYTFYKIHGDQVDQDKMNYDRFGCVKEMPKLNTNNYLLQDYLIEVGKHFLTKFHIDGYRLDVANEASHAFWYRFKQELRRIDPNLILIGECWNNATAYLSSNQMDSVMNYHFLGATKDFFINNTLTPMEYKNRLVNLLMRYDDNTNNNLLNLLDSHDTIRYYSFCHHDKNLYLASYLALIAFVGMPMIYYGNEIFMEGLEDPANRKGMEWNSKQFQSKEHQLFKDIINLRKLEAFRKGQMKLDVVSNLVKITRYTSTDSYVTLINHSGEDVNIDIKGEIILANQYQNHLIKQNGFVVYKDK